MGKYSGFQRENKPLRTFIVSCFSSEQPWNFWDPQVLDLTSVFRDGFACFGPTFANFRPQL